jgi:hypothetical protein
MMSQGMLPAQLFGMVLTPDMLMPAFIFDLALLVFLVHYGWHLGKIPLPRERAYLFAAGVLFAIVAVAHLMRLFASASLNLGGFEVPLWLSWVGVAVTGYLSYASFRFAARTK